MSVTKIRKESSALDGFYQAAFTKHHNGDLDGAERDYRDILVTNPDHAKAWHSLGLLMVDLKRFGEAEKAIVKAVELDPQDADARSNLGAIRMRNNNLSGAEKEILEALRINSDHSGARKLLAELRHRQGNAFAVQERFNDTAQAFRQAASLPGGKKLWLWKPLGFCPTVFRNTEASGEYWRRLHEGLDIALDSEIDIDWRSLPFDGFTPPFNLPHFGKCCRELKEKYARLFSRAFPHKRPSPRPPALARTSRLASF